MNTPQSWTQQQEAATRLRLQKAWEQAECWALSVLKSFSISQLETGTSQIKDQAQAFNIEPELAWLFFNDTEQRKLVDCIRKLNRGFNIDELEAMEIPLDKLLQNIVVLKALLRERGK